jgi:hypothetical protein
VEVICLSKKVFASLGVEAGSGDSLAIAGETLFYLSRAGVVAYSGGVPQNIASSFGTDRYRNAVGGSGGVKYYVSMEDQTGAWSLFVFDTRNSLWHREDATRAVGFAYDGGLYCLDDRGQLWLNGAAGMAPEGYTQEADVVSMAEFGDFTEYASSYPYRGSNKKGTCKLQMRIELEEGARVEVLLRFDSGEAWEQVATLKANRKRSYYLPILPRREDHMRVRLEGVGQWRLYSLTREIYYGSEL